MFENSLTVFFFECLMRPVMRRRILWFCIKFSEECLSYQWRKETKYYVRSDSTALNDRYGKSIPQIFYKLSTRNRRVYDLTAATHSSHSIFTLKAWIQRSWTRANNLQLQLWYTQKKQKKSRITEYPADIVAQRQTNIIIGSLATKGEMIWCRRIIEPMWWISANLWGAQLPCSYVLYGRRQIVLR